MTAAPMVRIPADSVDRNWNKSYTARLGNVSADGKNRTEALAALADVVAASTRGTFSRAIHRRGTWITLAGDENGTRSTTLHADGRIGAHSVSSDDETAALMSAARHLAQTTTSMADLDDIVDAVRWARELPPPFHQRMRETIECDVISAAAWQRCYMAALLFGAADPHGAAGDVSTRYALVLVDEIAAVIGDDR